MKSKGKWYEKVWIWLSLISAILLVGVFLFLIYLYKVNYIHLLDLRFVFTSKDGNYDWGVFWTALAAIGAIFVGYMSYKVNRRLTNFEIRKDELGKRPYLMFKNITFCKTKQKMILVSDRRGIPQYEGIEGPYFLDKVNSINGIDELNYFNVELLNVSKVFSKVALKEFTIKTHEGKTIAEFNGTTNNVKIDQLFIQVGEKQELCFVTSISDENTIKHYDACLKVILSNAFDDYYLQTFNFVILGVFGGYVKCLFAHGEIEYIETQGSDRQ